MNNIFLHKLVQLKSISVVVELDSSFTQKIE